MKLQIIAVGKLRDPHYRALTDEYMGRLEHYLPAEVIEVGESRLTDRDQGRGLAEEADAMRQATPDTAVTVAMDERGKHLTSRQLAQWINEWMIQGTHYVSFYIGSANGLDKAMREESQRRLALSKMTLPHEMARMVLAEQLYRAMTIIRGEPYHR